MGDSTDKTQRTGFLRRLARARDGGVALVFGLALPPLMMMTVAGVDLHRAATVRSSLQDALDAAALAAARSQYTDAAGVQRIGMASLRANMQNFTGVTLDESATSFTLTPERVVIAVARANVDAIIADILLPPYGQVLDDELPVTASSEVMRSNNRVEVALVLDNTGSMAGTKLANTKTAAIDLIDRLAAADGRSVEPDAVRISLVPFSFTVRVPTDDGQQPTWMTNSGSHTGGTGATGLFDTAVGRFTLFEQLNTRWAGCVEARPQPYDIRDTEPVTTDLATMFVPYFAPDLPDNVYTDSTYRSWTGLEPNNYLDDGTGFPSSVNSTNRAQVWRDRQARASKYSSTPRDTLDDGFGPNRDCVIQPLLRLTNDYDALRAGVNAMFAHGNTQVPMGAIWGWHTLSPNAPFGDGRPYGQERLLKIMILMTDGENVLSGNSSPNASTYSAQGYIWQGRLGITSGSNAQRRTALDNRLDHPTAGREDLCGNMKAQGIIIYTVAVQVDAAAQALMERCATSSDHYFNVTSASAIGAAFDRIAGSIENLRITR
ncbi:MAG: pilus assembly protein TadG-related protein [Brevundimonas sp.]|jgi:Flp pilus assembly protein TadG|uniref:pilus assembly protein TadG-related protein n=1 Tax=Brevundimonas sp. TaxID=1871086 RepID=UPI0022C46240|nr:pilus assembly protein [Brevundimonas sp.]